MSSTIAAADHRRNRLHAVPLQPRSVRRLAREGTAEDAVLRLDVNEGIHVRADVQPAGERVGGDTGTANSAPVSSGVWVKLSDSGVKAGLLGMPSFSSRPRS